MRGLGLPVGPRSLGSPRHLGGFPGRPRLAGFPTGDSGLGGRGVVPRKELKDIPISLWGWNPVDRDLLKSATSVRVQTKGSN